VCYAIVVEEDNELEFEEEDYQEEHKLYTTKQFYLREGAYWKVGKGLMTELGYQEPDRLRIPLGSKAKLSILEKLHDDPLSAHFGVTKTRLRVQRRFYWPRMKEDITRHIQTCESCQRNKAKQHKTYGLLSPLPVPSGPWESISFDILCGLPETGRFNNAIFVVVDRLTKMSHFKAFSFGGTGAEEIAKFLLEMVVRLHGVPLNDRDSRFTADAFKTVLADLGVRSNTATTGHTQTDGQTERINHILRDMLSHYVEGRQENWDEFLPLWNSPTTVQCKRQLERHHFYSTMVLNQRHLQTG
jgi:hypothetical protein